MGRTIGDARIWPCAAAILFAGGLGLTAYATEIDRANEALMRSYLGNEERREIGITDKGDDRSEEMAAGNKSGVEGLSVDITKFRVKGNLNDPKNPAVLFQKRRVKAMKGDVGAQLKLGLMLARGEGVEANYQQAAKWLRKPAEQGHAEAQFMLGEIYTSGKGDIARNDEEAAAWYLKAANQGYPAAQYRIGIMYSEGSGVTYNAYEAEKWLSKAAEGGDAKLQFSLAERFAGGNGVPRNSREAEKWYREAASKGDADMQFYLGRLYREEGEVVRQDREEAVKWFDRAAEQGHGAAKLSMGVMYLNGEGIQIDMVQAHKWLTLAAATDKEKGEAMKNLKMAEARMTPEQIKEAQALTAEWLARHKK